MSRGFDGFEFDDFQNPERDPSRGPDLDTCGYRIHVRRRPPVQDHSERPVERQCEFRPMDMNHQACGNHRCPVGSEHYFRRCTTVVSVSD